MKFVAAAKLRRAKEHMEEGRYFLPAVAQVFRALLPELQQSLRHYIKTDHAPAKKGPHVIVVMASDRGLCGPFNSYAIRATKQKAEALKKAGVPCFIVAVGNKSAEALKSSEYAANVVVKHSGIAKTSASYHEATAIADSVLSLFKEHGVGQCTLIYNHFYSAIQQKVESIDILPYHETVHESPLFSMPTTHKFVAAKSPATEMRTPAMGQMIIERFLTASVFVALLHHAASEHGARMTAMDNATRAAGDMIKRLSLTYNRTRQAAITKELIEIISGAEAV